jgi:putative ABC transport system permease protein
MFLVTLCVISCCAAAVLGYGTLVVLRVKPWWQPQYLIPLLGMVLGNTISGISVGLAATIEELSAGQGGGGEGRGGAVVG